MSEDEKTTEIEEGCATWVDEAQHVPSLGESLSSQAQLDSVQSSLIAPNIVELLGGQGEVRRQSTPYFICYAQQAIPQGIQMLQSMWEASSSTLVNEPLFKTTTGYIKPTL